MTRLSGFSLDHLRLTSSAPSDGAVLITVEGFLDYDSADYFLAHTTQSLTVNPGLRDLHVDFEAMTGIDSMGLSMLLDLHRRTTAAGVILHLDSRTEKLDRMLRITGTLAYLVPDQTAEENALSGVQEAASNEALPEGQRMAYRHTSMDGVSADGRPGSGSDMSS
ncbi:STAS domain-containing protein [Streptomyces sp. NPDC102487]|uniref:STAS domain-containing protein n=1 Tax=Streptomyces sp. NPDC102487 TaxID=3366182 RepID=UPI00382C4834